MESYSVLVVACAYQGVKLENLVIVITVWPIPSASLDLLEKLQGINGFSLESFLPEASSVIQAHLLLVEHF